MKLLVIGIGQCGGRIADEFTRLNRRARSFRNIEIITDAFAVNTNATDLIGLSAIKADNQHRILIGGKKTRGHGVAKLNELAAEIAREDGDKVIDAIRTSKRLDETDALLVIAGAAGGTGSGATPTIIQQLKDRYIDKPVYALIVLPFEHEAQNEKTTIYNTAVCLKSVYSTADAVILVDNQRYIKKDFSLRSNVSKTNELIVEPFHNLLCAGEEKKVKHIGNKMLDSGDIKATLSGWTAIGYGKSLLPLITLPFEKTREFRKKSDNTYKGIRAIDESLSELSIHCETTDAGSALYLLSAPAEEMNMELIKELNEYLRKIAPKAIIRNGDYPWERGLMDVVVVLSQLMDVERVREYYAKSASVVDEIGKMREAKARRLSLADDASRDVPSLL